MGCDIHSVIQVFPYNGKYNDKWKTVAFDIGDDRNYDTFAVYANVRNGYGFAGCPTGEGWVPISEPRGYPEGFQEDCDFHGVKEQGEEEFGQWMGDHSYSWLLLSEMQEKWKSLEDKEYEVQGYVDLDEYEKTLAIGIPPSHWCGVTSRTDVKKCSWKVKATDRLYTMKRHIRLMELIAELEEIKPESVRIVFGFDS